MVSDAVAQLTEGPGAPVARIARRARRLARRWAKVLGVVAVALVVPRLLAGRARG
jgi:hypothetical protein